MIEKPDVLNDPGFSFGEDVDHIIIFLFDIVGVVHNHFRDVGKWDVVDVPQKHRLYDLKKRVFIILLFLHLFPLLRLFSFAPRLSFVHLFNRFRLYLGREVVDSHEVEDFK